MAEQLIEFCEEDDELKDIDPDTFGRLLEYLMTINQSKKIRINAIHDSIKHIKTESENLIH